MTTAQSVASPPRPATSAASLVTASAQPNARADFPSADADNTADDALRFVGTRGEQEPWSEGCAATVAAELDRWHRLD